MLYLYVCLDQSALLISCVCACVCVSSCHIRYAQTRWRLFLSLSLWSIWVDGQYRLCQRPFIFLLKNRDRETTHIYSRWSERRNDRPYLITFYWLVTAAAPVSRPAGRNLFRIRLVLIYFLFYFFLFCIFPGYFFYSWGVYMDMWWFWRYFIDLSIGLSGNDHTHEICCHWSTTCHCHWNVTKKQKNRKTN